MSRRPDRLPGAEWRPGRDAGRMLPGARPSLLLHTMESESLDGAVRYLIQQGSCSHFAFDRRTGRLVQMVSLNRAARSLRSGGRAGTTNAAGCIQVEMTGYAKDAPNWSAADNRRIGEMIARIAAVVPFRVEMPLPFYGDRAGFTVASSNARQRMSWFNWYRFDAISGHQHAPANSHWDPGAIDTAQILTAARRPLAGAKPAHPPAKPGALTVSEATKLTKRIERERAHVDAVQKVFSQWTLDRIADERKRAERIQKVTVQWVLDQLRPTQDQVNDLTARLDAIPTPELSMPDLPDSRG